MHQEQLLATKTELYAERWWEDHGYTVRLVERVPARSTYELQKDGQKHTAVIPLIVANRKEYLQKLEREWE